MLITIIITATLAFMCPIARADDNSDFYRQTDSGVWVGKSPGGREGIIYQYYPTRSPLILGPDPKFFKMRGLFSEGLIGNCT